MELTSVQIGPINYAIEYVKDLTQVEGDKISRFAGLHDLTNAKISLESEMADSFKVVVLFHELIHAILDNAGVKEHSEDLIDVISFGLTDIIRQNPELLDYVYSKLGFEVDTDEVE